MKASLLISEFTGAGLRNLGRGTLAAMLSGLVMTIGTVATAETLRVDGAVIEGVDISGITYRAGELDVQLAPGSNQLVATAVEPEFDVPTEDLCGAANQTVVCTGDFDLLQDRVRSDSVELSAGAVYASELVLADTINPTLVVLEFRSADAILPTIEVSLSAEPGGAAVGSGGECRFTVSGYVGARVYLAHDGSLQNLKDRYCDITRGERYFLNMSLSGGGAMTTVRRTVKLTGI